MSFFGSAGSIRYLKNISWLMLERVLRIFAAFFVGVWVARYLGPVDFGALNYLQSLIGLFFILATLGLDEITIKELVEKKFNEYEIVGTTAVIKLIGSILCIIAVLAFIYVTKMDSYVSFLLFILSLSS
ncbi:oligosaccharide flippase family protein, partial [Campylobacter concisus]|uniref:oligosaccharide flippase family protein n=1 Tax=Campylobacter concisus TaxID=199 RepID=UPI00131BFC26